MTADTASPAAGAPAHDLAGWHAIPWPAAHHNVRRLQARIVKATQEGRGGKVKALQHLLTHSFSGKAIAVKRVTDNHGRLFLDSRVVDLTRLSNPIFVTISSLRPLFFNGLRNE